MYPAQVPSPRLLTQLRGEPLLWSGRPDPSVFFARPDLLIGVYLIAGRFFVKRNRKRRLEYALTRSRALICDSRGGVRDVPLAHAAIEQSTSGDGRHLGVTFGISSTGWSGGFGFGGARLPTNSGLDLFSSSVMVPAFVDVADVAGLQTALGQIDRG